VAEARSAKDRSQTNSTFAPQDAFVTRRVISGLKSRVHALLY